MSMCRYFLQGTCRFGDRCRFSHSDSDQKGYGFNYEGSSYHQQRNQNRYETNHSGTYSQYSGNYRTESPQRYSANTYENERYSGSDRNYNYRNEANSRYSSDDYGNNYINKPLYSHPGRNQSSSNYYQNQNTYGQNRYKWTNEDNKKQTPQKSYVDPGRNETYSTSTPKPKANFDLKLPESGIKKKGSSQYEVGELDGIHANLVKEDAKTWELGGQWPFTCYSPDPKVSAFPGFYDISPEELRYAAYKAKENNSFHSYVEFVEKVALQINQQRSELKVPTPQLLDTLRRLWNGENLDNSTDFVASIPFLQYDNRNDAFTTASSPSNAAAAFSFKTSSTDVTDSIKNSAAAFSFKTSDFPTAVTDSAKKGTSFSFKTTEVTSSTKVTVPYSGDGETYTPIEYLTDDEREQFSASTFMLGKIPTKPPPQVFCK